jgi:hypothetical protein
MRSICLKIREKWPAVLPPKRQLAAKKLPPNKLAVDGAAVSGCARGEIERVLCLHESH